METASTYAPQRADLNPSARHVVLVVDEDIETSSRSAMALSAQGWHAIVTNDPLTAASIARDLPIDVLVTDLDMPRMSGVELAGVVRVHHVDLPVVVVSGTPLSQPPMVEPPFTFLAKPFRLQALVDVLDSLGGSDDDARIQRVSGL